MGNPIDQTETIVHLALQGFEGQIRIIHSLGNHSDRKQHIENLRRMVVALSEAVENNKAYLLDGLENLANIGAKELDLVSNLLETLAKVSGDANVITCSREMNKSQVAALHRIGMSESNIANGLIQRSNTMQEKIKTVLAQVDALRR